MTIRFFVALGLCGTLGAATPVKQKAPKKPAADITATITADPEDLTRTIIYSDRDVATIHTALERTTIIILPKNENIRDFVCGQCDKQQGKWVVNGADGTGFAYIRPTKRGARTDLSLVTASNNVYSFMVEEGGQPDLKVYVETRDAAMQKAAENPKWVLASELASVQQEVGRARSEAVNAHADADRRIRDANTHASEEVRTFRAGFPSSLKHDYTYKSKLGVKAIAHTDAFTYIWIDTQEPPTLYEIKDKQPSLIKFEYSGGVYIADKVLDAGYLKIGKHRMDFRRKEAEN